MVESARAWLYRLRVWMAVTPCPICDGSKIVGGPRYHATGTLTDARSCECVNRED